MCLKTMPVEKIIDDKEEKQHTRKLTSNLEDETPYNMSDMTYGMTRIGHAAPCVCHAQVLVSQAVKEKVQNIL